MSEAMAKAFMAALNSKDVGRCMSLYTDDIVFQDFSLGDSIKGKKGLEEAFRDFVGMDYRFELAEWSGGGDCLVVEWNWKVKHSGEFLGVNAAGKETEVRGVSALKLQGGKIAQQHDYWDGAAVLRQLGAIKSS